ncbi:hypothetical protein Ancab_006733 [Ancistrocladus abbreviatus]
MRWLLLFASLLIHSTLAQITPQKRPQRTQQNWLTLNGQRPVVVARGGMSGLFPESSDFAYHMSQNAGLRDTILYCDLQLTKDQVGFCQGEIRLDNSTSIASLFPDGKKTYNVNGKEITGWFAVDYDASTLLEKTTLVQNVLTRPATFDDSLLVLGVTSVLELKPGRFWLNVQYDTFFNQHRLSAAKFLESIGFKGIQYISSPEIGFLKSISMKVDRRLTKLIFKFQGADAIEPTTNQTYGSMLKNLADIKRFASGILVPKEYIWPVGPDMYLQPATTLVADAHREGLEVHAYSFANDIPASFNYSYDPTAEYLQFVDNSQFSVDGVVTDFSTTAAEAIACLAHYKNASRIIGVKTLIISHDGASGDYAACTDLAYEKAVTDGADIIDCSVQMSKDGVAFCSASADLTKSTNAINVFMTQATTVPEIQKENGIFSFDLTWSEIQNLKPQLVNNLFPVMKRNPAYKDKGKIMTLTEFLNLAKTKAVPGVLIEIKNAAYLASKKSLDIVDAVTTALQNATFDKQSTQQVLIQSDDSSVLGKFKDIPTYRRVLLIEETFEKAPKQTVEEIKRHADAVTLPRASLVKTEGGFTLSMTKLVEEMHSMNISVYVTHLQNEFVSLAFDYFSDPYVEIATFLKGLKVDGVVTDYPATMSTYLRSPCAELNEGNNEITFSEVELGVLLAVGRSDSPPPAEAPGPVLQISDVVDPPLPAVAKGSTPSATAATPAAAEKSSGKANTAHAGLSLIAILVLGLLGCAGNSFSLP